MFRIKYLSLLLLAALMLSACQLFEPLPTLPVVLTLEPLVSDPIIGYTQTSSPPETAAASPQANQSASTQAAATSPMTSATLPVISSTLAPTQAQAAAASATSPPAAPPTRSAPTAASPSAWRDVPVMPGATQGEEEDGAYSYTVNASLAKVQNYYEQQMPLSGWAPIASGEGEAGNLLLMFQKGNVAATIGIITQDGSTLVLIIAE